MRVENVSTIMVGLLNAVPPTHTHTHTHTSGWEMYGDFPRMRRFLDANTYLVTTDSRPRANLTAHHVPPNTPTAFSMPTDAPLSPPPRRSSSFSSEALSNSRVSPPPSPKSARAPSKPWGSLNQFYAQQRDCSVPALGSVFEGVSERYSAFCEQGSDGGVRDENTQQETQQDAQQPKQGRGERSESAREEDDAAAAREAEREAGKAIVRTVQSRVLIVPLVVLLVLSLLLSSVQWGAAMLEFSAREGATTLPAADIHADIHADITRIHPFSVPEPHSNLDKLDGFGRNNNPNHVDSAGAPPALAGSLAYYARPWVLELLSTATSRLAFLWCLYILGMVNLSSATTRAS